MLRWRTGPTRGLGDLLYIATSPLDELVKGGPILHVFESDRLKTWFAVNDDLEVDSNYPDLAIGPGARAQVLVRVSAPEDDLVSTDPDCFVGPDLITSKRSLNAAKDGTPEQDCFRVSLVTPGPAGIRLDRAGDFHEDEVPRRDDESASRITARGFSAGKLEAQTYCARLHSAECDG